jgi:antitoxin component YwqK of YwqJK toxin-antitoxin module
VKRAWIALGLVACGGSTPIPPAHPERASEASESKDPPEPAAPVSLSRGTTWLCAWEQWEECHERCDAGNALSCARYSMFLENGWSRWDGYGTSTLEADPAAAMVAMERSCELGYGPACSGLGTRLVDDEGPKDLTRGTELLRRACDAEVAWACSWLAEQDGQDREALLVRACDLGDRDACLEAAVIAGDEHGDTKGALAGMSRAMHNAPASSSRAAAAVTCAAGTTAVEETDDLVLMGPPHIVTYCADADGKREGAYLSWFSQEDYFEGREHGVVVEEGTFRADTRDGHFVYRHDNGAVRSEGDFAAGTETGRWVYFSSRGDEEAAGNMVAGQRDGVWIEHDGQIGERDEGEYVAGKRHGRWIEHLDDLVFRDRNYVDGEIEGIETMTWPNGQKCQTGYQAGRQHGISKCWHPNGKKMHEGTWGEEGLEGAYTEWNEDGSLSAKGKYHHHKRVGKWTYYDFHGKKYRETTYDADGEEASSKDF